MLTERPPASRRRGQTGRAGCVVPGDGATYHWRSRIFPARCTIHDDRHPTHTGSGAARPRSRGVYLLPNLFTTAVLFSGFYAIVAATDGNFDRAGMAIFIAMVCDGLDGRIARWTNTQSEFGAQYDSLSDMVAFGLAPAVVAYQWGVARIAEYGFLWGRLGLARDVLLRRLRRDPARALQHQGRHGRQALLRRPAQPVRRGVAGGFRLDGRRPAARRTACADPDFRGRA